MIRIVLPPHLQSLANAEAMLDVNERVTLGAVLAALEAR